MSDNTSSRFAPQNKSTHERLSTNTVGLVALSDFRKRRAQVLEQQEREAREAAFSGASTPDRSHTATPDNAGSDSASGPGMAPAKKKKKRPQGKKLLSFDDEDGDEGDSSAAEKNGHAKSKFKANAAVGVIPKATTKSALRREAAERETLRREFVQVQEAVKATEIAIPFVFYDGINTPGGMVRMRKSDFIWVFLDKSRKVGAELGVGDQSTPRKSWARVGVDDLMLVRDTVIIPHHYDFYFFVMNKSIGPGGHRLFGYRNEAPPVPETPDAGTDSVDANRLVLKASKAAAPDIKTLEGATDDPTRTKVVDRRWYLRNKHIYPASTWQEFDPEKDYANEIRKDTGGNTFFYSK
ncbi:hypothetical protein JDV02_006572 [Purpureocillium takamizusanense]|uniref:FAM50A/XAP5 C-terminal domain-containing protein n=1 Tax=Purpureocillium takamizusanense TaxID=2060973 RepID=A0A9Q8VD55_9HYPO|nr:uncharacterized protein JDV02_006572 [Purpureocillium takamizusanense]UNI20492.1 hypothetical protein JDV02_006572 [Purpureocillium takamizusanense]